MHRFRRLVHPKYFSGWILSLSHWKKTGWTNLPRINLGWSTLFSGTSGFGIANSSGFFEGWYGLIWFIILITRVYPRGNFHINPGQRTWLSQSDPLNLSRIPSLFSSTQMSRVHLSFSMDLGSAVYLRPAWDFFLWDSYTYLYIYMYPYLKNITQLNLIWYTYFIMKYICIYIYINMIDLIWLWYYMWFLKMGDPQNHGFHS